MENYNKEMGDKMEKAFGVKKQSVDYKSLLANNEGKKSRTLEKLIKECEYKLKSGKPNYQNTVECDWLLRNLKEVKKEINQNT